MTILDLFLENVKRAPQSPCIIYKNHSYTYEEIHRLTDNLAHYLMKNQVKKGEIVPILVGRSELMPISTLGILKTGAAYQPIDPVYPPERIAFMLSDTGATRIIAEATFLDLLKGFKGDIIGAHEIFNLPSAPDIMPTVRIQKEDPFTILYTSGSTGNPKGVILSHDNILAFCKNYHRVLNFDHNCRHTASSSFGFDAHIMDLYPALTAGGAVCIVPDESRLNLLAMAEYLEKNQVTHAFMTSQLARQFALNVPCRGLKYMIGGGEKLVPFRPKHSYTFANVYGPTEATVFVTAYFIDENSEDAPIGRPLPNVDIYLIDEEGALVPKGQVGELCIGGPQVACGYHNRPDLTELAFVDNPFKPGQKMYKTGDLCSLDENDNYIFIGRRDHQVKIRGYRVEMTEIEYRIREFPDIQDATVAAYNVPGGGQALAAFVVSNGEIDLEKLRAFMLEKLPDYTNPTILRQIDKIPLNQNHKVDKRALPLPGQGNAPGPGAGANSGSATLGPGAGANSGSATLGPGAGANTEPPAPESSAQPPENTKDKIRQILVDIVGHGDFQENSDLFQEGLSSIGAVSLNLALSQTFNISIGFDDIAQNPTLNGLCQLIGADNKAPIPLPVRDYYPLTQAQLGIYVDCLRRPQTTAYNLAVLFSLPQRVDKGKLKEALEQAILAHPHIKATVGTQGGRPVLYRDDKSPLEIEMKNLDALFSESVKNENIKSENIKNESIKNSDIAESAPLTCVKNSENEAFLRDKLVLPFIFAPEGQRPGPENPLARLGIYELKGQNYLFIDIHHIISDGASLDIFLNSTISAYNGEKIVKNELSFYDLTLMEEENRKGDLFLNAKNHFARLFSRVDKDMTLPQRAAQSKLGKNQEKGAKEERSKDKKPSQFLHIHRDDIKNLDISRYCQNLRITENAYFNGAFGLAVASIKSRKDSVFSTIYNGRKYSYSHDIFGMMVKTLPILAQPGNFEYISDYLLGVKKQLIEAMERDIYSFTDMNRDLQIRPDLMLVYQGDSFYSWNLGGETIKPLYIKTDPPATLAVEVFKEGEGFDFNLAFNGNIYENQQILEFAKIFFEILKSLKDCERIQDINLLTQDEMAELEEWNNTSLPIGFIDAGEKFHRVALKKADEIAVICGDTQVTFRELDDYSNSLAEKLVQLGIGPDNLVGLLLPRCWQAYGARLGILKGGAGFLSLGTDYPPGRIEYIVQDSKAPLVITDSINIEKNRELFAKLTCKIWNIDDLEGMGKSQIDNSSASLENTVALGKREETKSQSGAPQAIGENDLAYCLYTSGSTGRPKGVLVEQGNLANYLDHNPGHLHCISFVWAKGPALALSALTFDVSVMENLVPLCNGITVVLATEEEIYNPAKLAECIIKNQVKTTTFVPSFLTSIIDLPQIRQALSGINSLNIGGENFSSALFEKLRAINPHMAIYNCYGPTEATISCTCHKIKQGDIVLGRPMTNAKIHIMGPLGQILPPNLPGELVVSGAGIARGYLNDPVQKDCFFHLKGDKAYKTGDMALWREDGNLVFIGRMDYQVKLRGLRIELGEIEGIIASYPGVISVAVTVKDLNDRQHLCAYYTGDKSLDGEKMAQYCQYHLSPYMVPSSWNHLPQLPLTAHGKVDLSALPSPVLGNRGAKRAIKSEAEADFCRLFGQILGRSEIGGEDNFFDLGGSSLDVAQLLALATALGYGISFTDIFDNPTPFALAELAEKKKNNKAKYDKNQFSPVASSKLEKEEKRDKEKNIGDIKKVDETEKSHSKDEYSKIDEILAKNIPVNLKFRDKGNLGNILLTGATGFLGVHILNDFLKNNSGRAYCIVRHEKEISLQDRLLGNLFYFFGRNYSELLGDRIIIVEGDITNEEDIAQLEKYDIQTVINCAASVKHFAQDDHIARINVGGTENIVNFSRKKGATLIHISTTSVAGFSVDGRPDPDLPFRETDFFVGQSVENKYIQSKFQAEKLILENIAKGLKAKIMRVGNLMARSFDGEFQINFRSNSFLNSLKAYHIIGKIPFEYLNQPVELSAVDKTAEAILLLAGTPEEYTVYHPFNIHLVFMGDIIRIMNENDLFIMPVEVDSFKMAFEKVLMDSKKAPDLFGLIAYQDMIKGKRVKELKPANNHTVQALYRLNFSWPIVDKEYLNAFIKLMKNLGFF